MEQEVVGFSNVSDGGRTQKVSKNTNDLQSLCAELLRDYEKDLKRAKTKSISEQWKIFERKK
jgi:hypothetical protein